MAKDPASVWTGLLPEGIIIAGLTLAGYLIAFVRELAFANYFGIPPELISLSWSQLFIGAGSLLLSLGWTFIMTEGIVTFLPESWKARDEVLAVLGGFLSVPIGIYLIHGSDWENYPKPGWILFVFSTGLLALVLSLVAISWATNRWGKKSLASGMSRADPRSLSDLLRERVPGLIVVALVVVGIVVVCAHSVGHQAAIDKTDFFVSEEIPGFIGLAIYGEIVIWAKRGEGARELTRTLRFSKLTEQPTSWTVVEAGPFAIPVRASSDEDVESDEPDEGDKAVTRHSALER